MVSTEEAKITPHRVGPFDISTSGDQMVLRLENRGEMTMQGCLLFLFTMLFITLLGIFAVVQTYSSTTQGSSDDPSLFFAPTRNHFGFLWLLLLLGTVIGLPLYMRQIYKSALVWTFRRSDDAFLRDNRLITRLRRVEYLAIRETRDPDTRYLYLLNIVYNDGEEMLLHNGYDEREIMNLANEIAAFVDTRVFWK
jgi:hypothetical protein